MTDTAASPATGAKKPRGVTRRQKARRSLLFGFLLVFPLTFNYYSPALPIQGTFERVACFSLLFWSAWMVASLVLGRASCGYICPLGGFQELWDYAVGRNLVRVGRLAIVKYAVFILWIGAIALAAARSGGWDRVEPFYMTEHYVSWDRPQSAIVYVGMLGLVILLCLPMGRRAFCHYVCWWAPLNTIGTKAKNRLGLWSLNLRAQHDMCVQCGTCDRVCPMSLPVSAMVAREAMSNTECILCGSCVDNCPKAAVTYAWRRGGH